MEGLWVRTSVKVEITKEEKRLIGRPSSPRWEIDIVAYSGRDNLLYAVECKSYLDSRVHACADSTARTQIQQNGISSSATTRFVKQSSAV